MTDMTKCGKGGKVPWRGERSMNRYHSIPYFRTWVSCEQKVVEDEEK